MPQIKPSKHEVNNECEIFSLFKALVCRIREWFTLPSGGRIVNNTEVDRNTFCCNIPATNNLPLTSLTEAVLSALTILALEGGYVP